MKMSRSGIIAFTTFLAFLTLFSVVYEYNLNFEEVLKYILIGIAIMTVIGVGLTVCYICSVQIQTMIDNKNAEIHHLTTSDDTTSLGNYSLRSMNFRSNIAIIQMMERLSHFSDCAVKPVLPTYSKALIDSFPYAFTTELMQCSPPPPYTIIEMPPSPAFLQECPPPPNYDNIPTTDTEDDDQLPVYSTSLPATTPANFAA